jgi:invasion protein IalB
MDRRKGRGAAFVNWHWSQGCRGGRLGAGAAWLAILVGTTMPGFGQPQTSSAPRRFGDWEVVCGPGTDAATPGDAADRPRGSGCRAVQRLTVQDTGDTAFLLSVLSEGKGALVGIVSIPLGGYLVPGIELTVDRQKPYRLLIETCTSAGCHAGFPLTGRVEKDMRSGRQATFRVWTAKDRPADIPVSLRGFPDALAALESRS